VSDSRFSGCDERQCRAENGELPEIAVNLMSRKAADGENQDQAGLLSGNLADGSDKDFAVTICCGNRQRTKDVTKLAANA
jgi:hypothetical protein